MQPLNLFGSVVWKGYYNGDLLSLRNKAESLLLSSNNLNTGLERDGGVSSSSDPDAPHLWAESQEFIYWAQKNSIDVWNNWGYPNIDRHLGNSWANLHPPGGWTDIHTHGVAKQVITLYLDQPNNGGNLEFQNPLFYHWQGYYNGVPEWIEVPVKTGNVVMFPGWISHRSQKNMSKSNRIVLSFNIG